MFGLKRTNQKNEHSSTLQQKTAISASFIDLVLASAQKSDLHSQVNVQHSATLETNNVVLDE